MDSGADELADSLSGRHRESPYRILWQTQKQQKFEKETEWKFVRTTSQRKPQKNKSEPRRSEPKSTQCRASDKRRRKLWSRGGKRRTQTRRLDQSCARVRANQKFLLPWRHNSHQPFSQEKAPSRSLGRLFHNNSRKASQTFWLGTAETTWSGQNHGHHLRRLPHRPLLSIVP